MTTRRLAAFLLACAALAAPAAAARRLELALTFDDLPAHGPLPAGDSRAGIARRIATALKAAHAPAFGFLIGSDVGDADTRAAVAAWHAAGFRLGNHSWSHFDLNDVSAAAFTADIARDEPALRAARASGWRWFRYPYLSEGDDPAKRLAVRGWLAAHRYRIAAADMDFADYLWSPAAERCAASGNRRAVARLERSYLAAAEDAVSYSRQMARAIYGRDIPYVLLLHVGAFDARMMPRLLALYRRDGFRFVSLAHAERDPVYRRDVDPALAPEPSDLQDRAYQRGLPAPDPRDDEAALDALCR